VPGAARRAYAPDTLAYRTASPADIAPGLILKAASIPRLRDFQSFCWAVNFGPLLTLFRLMMRRGQSAAKTARRVA